MLPMLFSSVSAGEIGPFTGPEADLEAARLYSRANDFVNNVFEGDYSYSYVQFHWKLANANIERILHAYPSSATAHQLLANEYQIGPFARDYFKQRVLPRLEEKKVGSFDAINNAIFLYYLESNVDVKGRKELLTQIIITLCRQKRWGEALNFPVLEEGQPWLWQIVARQAGYKNDKLADSLVTNSEPTEQSILLALIAESRAFRGDTLEELNTFLQKYADHADLRSNVFTGLVRREIAIESAVQLKKPLQGIYDNLDKIENPKQRVDLADYLSSISPGPSRQVAESQYARYLASGGRLDEARKHARVEDTLTIITDYADYLVLHEDYQQAIALPESFALSATDAIQFRLKLLELLAQVGRKKEVKLVRDQIPAEMLDQAMYHEWLGRILSTKNQLVVREHTFSDLTLNDPNLIGRLICEWSLTPNRSLRGAAPWDAVVFKFSPGFENLPEYKDKKKIEAAGL